MKSDTWCSLTNFQIPSCIHVHVWSSHSGDKLFATKFNSKFMIAGEHTLISLKAISQITSSSYTNWTQTLLCVLTHMQIFHLSCVVSLLWYVHVSVHLMALQKLLWDATPFGLQMWSSIQYEIAVHSLMCQGKPCEICLCMSGILMVWVWPTSMNTVWESTL